MIALAALLLAASPPVPTSRWLCVDRFEHGSARIVLEAAYTSPNHPIASSIDLEIETRGFRYGWARRRVSLEPPLPGPDRVALSLRFARAPQPGFLVLSARGERAVRIPIGAAAAAQGGQAGTLMVEVTRPREARRLAAVPVWTARLLNNRDRVRQVLRFSPPGRAELQALHEVAAARMSDAGRGPDRSRLCRRHEADYLNG